MKSTGPCNAETGLKEKILLGIFFIAVFVQFLGPIFDPDFPFHLKSGEYIYEHQEIPEDDPFSFYGEGVITDRERFTLGQYWIAQIVFYKLYSVFGPSGIILLRASVFTLFIFLIWFVLKRRGFYFSLAVAVIITVMFQSFKVDRPQFFSFLFTLVLVLLIERFRKKPDSAKPLLFVPPLMLLWANMHAGFVFGLAVLSVYTVTEGVKFLLKKPNLVGATLHEKEASVFFVAVLFAVLFSYVNPLGNEQLITTLRSHTEARWLYRTIREYMSPLEAMEVYFGIRSSIITFLFLFAYGSCVLALHIVRKKSIDITVLALFCFSSVAAFTAVRYMPFFVAVAMPLSREYRFISGDFRTPRKLAIVGSILVLLFSLNMIGKKARNYPDIFRWKINAYPEKVANFLLSQRMDANMFNLHNRGSYLLWRLYPYYKVFNDTRFISLDAVRETDVISHALEDYQDYPKLGLEKALMKLVPEEFGEIDIVSQEIQKEPENSTPLWKKLLIKYNIELIVHEACYEYTKEMYPLILRLLKDDDWVLIYLDGSMLIFVRDNEKFSRIIEEHRLPKKLIYDQIIFETILLVRNKVPIPAPYSSLGFAYMMKGIDRKAEQMIEAALALDKNDLVANFSKAYLLLKKNARDTATGSDPEQHTSGHGI